MNVHEGKNKTPRSSGKLADDSIVINTGNLDEMSTSKNFDRSNGKQTRICKRNLEKDFDKEKSSKDDLTASDRGNESNNKKDSGLSHKGKTSVSKVDKSKSQETKTRSTRTRNANIRLTVAEALKYLNVPEVINNVTDFSLSDTSLLTSGEVKQGENAVDSNPSNRSKPKTNESKNNQPADCSGVQTSDKSDKILTMVVDDTEHGSEEDVQVDKDRSSRKSRSRAKRGKHDRIYSPSGSSSSSSRSPMPERKRKSRRKAKKS